jgi:hypothetical protein
VTALECAREHEVVSAVLSRRWPGGCDEDLSVHAAQCPSCGEVAMIAGLMREDQDAARSEIRVPAAGQVWWRAAVRARLEAAQAAGRPITWIHGLAGASAAGLAWAALGAAWPTLRQTAAWTGARVSAFEPDATAIAALVSDTVLRGLPLALAIGACLVLAPIALYFALSDD